MTKTSKTEGYIYKLVDPETEEVRYVGETSGPLMTRLGNHLKDSLSRRSRKTDSRLMNWMLDLASRQRMPEIVLLEIVPQVGDKKLDKRSRLDRESVWIKIWREQGFDLLNVKSGMPFGTKRGPSPRKGKRLPPKILQAVRNGVKNRLSDPISRSQMLQILSKARDARWTRYRNMSDDERKLDHERRSAAAKKMWQKRRAS